MWYTIMSPGDRKKYWLARDPNLPHPSFAQEQQGNPSDPAASSEGHAVVVQPHPVHAEVEQGNPSDLQATLEASAAASDTRRPAAPCVG